MDEVLVGATIGLWVLIFTLLVFPALLTPSAGQAHRNIDGTLAKGEERTGATGGAPHGVGRGSATAGS